MIISLAEQARRKEKIENTTVICQAGGCLFTEEYKEDLKQIIQGTLTFEDLEQKHLAEIARLKKEKPEMFEGE